MDNLIGNKPPLFKCTYYRYQIKDLEVLYIRDINTKRTYVAMAVDCGSKYDTKAGTAHLLEHLLFISPEQRQADGTGIDLNDLRRDIQQNETIENARRAIYSSDGTAKIVEKSNTTSIANDACDTGENEMQDEDENAPKINDFDSFLNTYNGDSNAYTAEDETVYHYELDNAGMLQSFRLFSNFFKHPLINKRTVASESQVVDSEFQNRKNDDESRINRILEISAGKKFSTGSLLSLGNDHEELKRHCEDLYAKRYRKMVLVVCSSERNEDMKKILEDSFSLDLDAVVYTDRTCVICSKHGLNGKLETEHEFKDQVDVPNGESQSAERALKERQNDGNDLKITKLYKYRPIFPKKRVIVSVSLPSEHVQYHNVYDSLIYFFTKEDHSSLLYTLKNSRLIFNGTVCTTTTQRETMVCFDFTVPSTDTYTAIVHEINRYFQIYKKSQAILSYYNKIEKDVNWQLYEEDDMRAHVVDCAERMLRSKVLFSDLMCEHECTNLVLNECTVVLVDDDYECERVADDEYELCYEEIKCVGCADDRKSEHCVLNGANCVADDRKSERSAHENISTIKTQPVNLHCSQRTPREQNDRLFTVRHPVGSIIKDKDVNAALKVIESASNRLVFIKDSFQTTKTVIQLFLCYRTSIMDVINFTELIDQLNVVYNHVLRTNAISVTHHVFHDGVLFEIAGLDPFFVLLNVLNFDGILEMMSSTTCTLNVLNDVKVSLEDEMYDAGYVRTSNSIKNVYIEGYSTVEREYEMVKDMIDDLRVRESAGTGTTGTSRQFIPYNEVQSVLLIVNGCSNEECYHDVFKKICARIKGKGPAPKLRIGEEYACTQDVFSVLNEGNKKFSSKETNGKMSTCHITSPERVGDKPMKLNECLVFNKKINARLTIKARNTSNAVFFRIGNGIKSLAICKILVHLMNEKFFTSLRTEQGLGYVVYCSYKSIKDEHFLMFNVQSDKNVLFNIFEFIEEFDIQLENFEALKNEIMESMKSRAQVTKHYFNLFYTGCGSLHTFRHDLCNFIDNVSVIDLKNAFRESELCVIDVDQYQEDKS